MGADTGQVEGDGEEVVRVEAPSMCEEQCQESGEKGWQERGMEVKSCGSHTQHRVIL